jgi:hypothetical protein
VLAAEVTIASPDFGQLEPVLTAAQSELKTAGVTDVPTVVLADAGYWHQDQVENIVGRGTQVLIPPDSSKRNGHPAGVGWWPLRLYATGPGRLMPAERFTANARA